MKLSDRLITIALWAIFTYIGVGAVLIACGVYFHWAPVDDVIAFGFMWPLALVYFLWHLFILAGSTMLDFIAGAL